MVHTPKNATLGRKAAPRKALLTGQCNDLLQHKKIVTTHAKAKALARNIAPIITHARKYAKINLNHAYRFAFDRLHNKKSVTILFNDILPAVKNRAGGYTRILKMGRRKGDAAKMSFIELVDFNTTYTKVKHVKTRRGRKKAKSTLPATTKPLSSQPKEVDKTLPATPVKKEAKPTQATAANPTAKQ